MKLKISKIIIILILVIAISSVKGVNAESIQPKLSGVEYSEEYKKWLELSDEERKKTVMPKMYDVRTETDSKTYLKDMDNLFRTQILMRASAVDSRFDLRDEIGENVKVRNQLGTGLCWTFATIGALESNLGLRANSEFDFSEKHMAYGTTRKAFNNNEVNKFGYSKEVNDGGNFYMATQYMASGMGAVDEEDMPFNESSENINISEIQQANVKTTLYDTVVFETLPDNAETAKKNELMTQMKQHIINYGGIYAGITGANMLDVESDMYNNETGAIYNNNEDDLIDHAVTIIGWDDNYSVNNFNENQRPQNNGAWIIKNSWGSSISSNLTSLKEEIFNANPDMFKGQGINTASEIPNETIINAYEESFGEGKVNIQEDNLVIEIGEKGYMYISYEDKKIYKELYGVEKALYGKEYKNIYQNDELGQSYLIEATTGGENLYLANVFTRDSSVNEAIDRISVTTNEEYKNCKVWINPKGNSKAKEDLQEVELAEGETVTCKPGYRSIMFAEPVELTGDSFVIVLEIDDTDDQSKTIPVETRNFVESDWWDEAEVNEGESFYTYGDFFERGEWIDLGNAQISQEDFAGNLCIKAYSEESEGTDDTQEPSGQGPVLSKFDNAKSAITEAKIYFESQDIEKSSIEMTIKVSGIQLGDETNTYKHYYHLSGTKGDTNITDWKETKIQKENDGSYSLVLTVDSTEMGNLQEIAESENLYVYIREVAQANGQESEQIITLQTENQSEPEIYVDQQLVGNIEQFFNSYGNTNNASVDNTVANKSLPNAGSMAFKVVVVLGILAFGGFALYRYKNIDK